MPAVTKTLLIANIAVFLAQLVADQLLVVWFALWPITSPQYANAGIARYWVIDLDGRRAITHEEPLPGGYARVETVLEDGTVDAPELGVSIRLGELLAFALR